MRAEEVARYLKEHPEFFEEHADILASIQLPHPYGGRAIPIAERQVLGLREKSRTLEGKLRELVSFGEENDDISERLHRITLALLAARELPSMLDALYTNLRDDFALPAVALRTWIDAAVSGRIEFVDIGQDARAFAEDLTEPRFSAEPIPSTDTWLAGSSSPIRSLAYVPLRIDRSIGLLVLGSEDPERFAPDKGTLYLTRLGQVVSMALKRWAKH